jgi:hypothetical protein
MHVAVMLDLEDLEAAELLLIMLLELLEAQILEVAEEEDRIAQYHNPEEQVVLVSSSSDIKSDNKQLRQLVEQFLMLVVRLFILLLHQRPLPSLILL